VVHDSWFRVYGSGSRFKGLGLGVNQTHLESVDGASDVAVGRADYPHECLIAD